MLSAYKFAKIETLLSILDDNIARDLFPIHFPWFSGEYNMKNYILAARATHGQGPYIDDYRKYIEPLLYKKLQASVHLADYLKVLNKIIFNPKMVLKIIRGDVGAILYNEETLLETIQSKEYEIEDRESPFAYFDLF